MTYSICARDASTGEMGVAVQSHFFSVGSIVTWGEAGVGVVATQSFAEPAYGPDGLALMRGGASAGDALAQLVAADTEQARRQVAFVDAAGGVGVHTGALCIHAAGHAVGAGVSCQANMMERDTVWGAMLAAYDGASGSFAERLVAALAAAQDEGGDIRGQQSAAILVVAGESSGKPWIDRLVELRVEDHPAPVEELGRLVRMRRAYDAVDRAEHAAIAGDIESAAREYEAALPDMGDNVEAAFWAGVELAKAGRLEDAKRAIAPALKRHAGWAELLRRLPSVELFPAELVDEMLR